VSAKKTERLLNLVICLLHTRRYLSVQEIRTAVPGYAQDTEESFRRMFERDKDELRELGIPLETGTNSAAHDDEPGYRIARRDYELPAISLEPDEAAALGLAARLWQSAPLAGATGSALLKLRAAGVQLALTGEAPKAVSNRFEGQTFVLSGVFEQHSRDELQTLIEAHGGKVTGSISKKLSYLVAGDKMGPVKREKATELKVPIISETDLLAMLPSDTEAAEEATDMAPLTEAAQNAPVTTATVLPAEKGHQGSLF